MYQTKRFLGCLLPIVFFLPSCFHKSDKTCQADDIINSFSCHTSNGDFLITHESIFHATSKSSGSKGTFISGYTDYRYTVRDLHTGLQQTRLVTGEREEDLLPIGYDGTQLWCYSADKQTGLHSRNPESMELMVSQQQVENVNPSLAGNINAPSFIEAGKFFRYDPVNKNIMLTDLKGNLFTLNPVTLKATGISKKPSFPNSFSYPYAETAHMVNGELISLSGNPRNKIDFDGDNKSAESFLSGKILLEQNTNCLSSTAANLLKQRDTLYIKKQWEYDSLLSRYPVLKDKSLAYRNNDAYHAASRFYELQNDLAHRKRESGYKADEVTRNLNNLALGNDSNTIYILHANNLTDTASVLISKIIIKENAPILQWTTIVPHIYFDPSKGIKRDRMAEVFKSGNPQFRYEWYGVEGNMLVGIKMLFAFGIDIRTGRVVWEEQL